VLGPPAAAKITTGYVDESRAAVDECTAEFTIHASFRLRNRALRLRTTAASTDLGFDRGMARRSENNFWLSFISDRTAGYFVVLTVGPSTYRLIARDLD
jgi:hypothetical protein